MCQARIDKAMRIGKGLNITLADCVCLCANLPMPPGNPTSEEVCGDCGHAHSTDEYTVVTPEGPRNVRMTLRGAAKK
jgi:hypothetical protein